MLSIGFGTMLTDLSNINWEFMDHASATIVHGAGLISFAAAAFIGWPKLKERIKAVFKKN